MMTNKEKMLLEEFSQFSLFSLPQTPYFENMKQDSCGNYHFIKPGKNEKVQIIFRIAPTGILVGNQMEEGYEATILGNEKQLTETLLYAQNSPIGIIRSKEENQWYLEYFDDNHEISPEVFTRKNNFVCKGKKLYGENIDEVITLFYANFLSNDVDSFDKEIDFTVWNSSLSGESGLVSALRHANADQIIYFSLADSKEFTSNNGPALVLKDGNYVLPMEQRSHIMEWAKNHEITFESFVGKTDKAMELLDIHSFNKRILGFYLPTLQYQSNFKEIFWSDVEKTRNILLKFIASL